MSPLSDEDGHRLLGVARRALEESVRGKDLPEVHEFSGAALERAGVFVTLRNQGALRGCIGQVEPCESLVETTVKCTAAAALHDPRFSPVDASELPDLSIEINVLSRPFDIRPEEIEIGRHGLLVSSLFARGLLLPEVAVDWNWNAERFLDETCRKAGLPEGAWRRGARIQAFTTQVFAEPGFHAAVRSGAAARSPKYR
jgi:AmmeMemoRadiSam system protein A